MALPAVLPSVTCHGVGTLIAIISQLNTLPACAPVNASMATLRLATHDSGSGWFANPFLCDSFIHDSTPVYPGARHGLLTVGRVGSGVDFRRSPMSLGRLPPGHHHPFSDRIVRFAHPVVPVARWHR